MALGTFERFISKRYLFAGRKGFISVTALFSLIGLWLGVSALIITMSVMNGFKQEFISRILGLNGALGVYSPRGALFDYDAMAKEIEAVSGVHIVIPMIEQQTMVSNAGKSRGAMLRGIRPVDMERRKLFRQGLAGGTFEDLNGQNTVALGYKLADRLNVSVGDTVTLISPDGTVTAFGTIPRITTLRVIGTFDVGMHEYDSNFMFTSLSTAQNLFDYDQSVSNLEIYIKDPEQANILGPQIQRQIQNRGRVYDWQRSNSAFFNAIQVQRNVLFIIMTLIILVAAFNIISSLVMLVKEKTKDIAILRTMGASQGQIMRIFVVTGSLIGFFGTAFGVATSLVFCRYIDQIKQFLERLTGTELFSAEVYFLATLPAKVDPMEVVTIALLSFSLSFLATIYPAIKASKMDPVEGLYA